MEHGNEVVCVKSSPTRLAYLDNLKSLMIILVIIQHAAVTYSGLGSWYYVEPATLGNYSFYTFVAFQTFNQAYFMSLLFMISGYFVPTSLEKKGVRKFISDRVVRLGGPTLVYMLFIHPFCVKMAYPHIDLFDYYTQGILSGKIVGWTGPLWFAEALLIFTLVYVFVKKWCDALHKIPLAITVRNVLTLVSLITVVAFALRLFFPIGTSFLNFQLCFFSAYIFMFILGTLSCQNNLFDTVDYTVAKKWLFAAFGFGLPLWVFCIYFGVERSNDTKEVVLGLGGGMNGISFLWALWESFFCVSIIIALIGIFKEKYNCQNSLQKFLSANAFGSYVFHAPILIGVSVLLKELQLPPIVKCVVVSTIAIPATFTAAWIIRSIPPLRKIFS